MKELPNLLCLTREIPQTVNAGSMQLFRVLSGYPPDKLLVVGPAPDPEARLLDCRYATLRLSVTRWINSRLHQAVNLANVMGAVRDFDGKAVDELVQSFRPQLVLTVMDCYSYYKWACLYARARRLPFMTITMDDPTQFERVPDWALSRQQQAVRRIYSYASRSLGVSREMAEYLERQYDRPTETFYFGPPDGLRPREASQSGVLKQAPRLTLGYAGSLGYYGAALADWGPVLEQADACLNIYGGEADKIPDHPRITHRGRFSQEEVWERVKAECDAVILAYSFDPALSHLYRTHFPTKLSEYCWLGMPVVISGPPSATGVRWGKAHKDAAITLTEEDPAIVAGELQRLRQNSELRTRLSVNAALIAATEFEPGRIRRRFVDHLALAAAANTAHRPS